MQETLTTESLTVLEEAILRTVVYSDLFDFPLTPEEIRRWLPVEASADGVREALASPRLAPMLSQQESYVCLIGRSETTILRERRCRASASQLGKATWYGRAIARLPFVRMVAITGSLAVENADDDDDLDYLIVTAPGRVWLTRAMTMLVVRQAALRGVTLCPNYLLAENALALPERDFYTARELRQMVPVAGHDVHARMLQVNDWWREHLPNHEAPAPAHSYTGRWPGRGLVERALMLRPFDSVEAWLLKRKGAELRRDAGAEAVFDESMCKGHFEGWRERTRQMVEERMSRLLEPTS